MTNNQHLTGCTFIDSHTVQASLSAVKLFALFLFVTVLCGCAHQSPGAVHSPVDAGMGGVLVPKGFVDGQGDVGHFIIQTAVHYGKKPPSAKEMPLISDQWSYSEYDGSHDITIRLSPEKYADVKSFLDQFFGPPYFKRDGKDSFYSYGLTKPVNGGAIHTFVENFDGHYFTDISIYPP